MKSTGSPSVSEFLAFALVLSSLVSLSTPALAQERTRCSFVSPTGSEEDPLRVDIICIVNSRKVTVRAEGPGVEAFEKIFVEVEVSYNDGARSRSTNSISSPKDWAEFYDKENLFTTLISWKLLGVKAQWKPQALEAAAEAAANREPGEPTYTAGQRERTSQVEEANRAREEQAKQERAAREREQKRLEERRRQEAQREAQRRSAQDAERRRQEGEAQRKHDQRQEKFRREQAARERAKREREAQRLEAQRQRDQLSQDIANDIAEMGIGFDSDLRVPDPVAIGLGIGLGSALYGLLIVPGLINREYVLPVSLLGGVTGLTSLMIAPIGMVGGKSVVYDPNGLRLSHTFRAPPKFFARFAGGFARGSVAPDQWAQPYDGESSALSAVSSSVVLGSRMFRASLSTSFFWSGPEATPSVPDLSPMLGMNIALGAGVQWGFGPLSPWVEYRWSPGFTADGAEGLRPSLWNDSNHSQGYLAFGNTFELTPWRKKPDAKRRGGGLGSFADLSVQLDRFSGPMVALHLGTTIF